MQMYQDMKFRVAVGYVLNDNFDGIPEDQFKKVHTMYKRMAKDLEVNKQLGQEFKDSWIRVISVLKKLEIQEMRRFRRSLV